MSACGIVLVDHHDVLNMVAASTEEARLLELSQLQNSEGPCLEAFRTGRSCESPDLSRSGPRWPRFGEAAHAAGFAAVHALPMRLRTDVLGALNLLNTAPGALQPDTVALGQALADAATIGLVHQRALARQELITEQLQAALNSRIMIEQVKGFIAQRLGVSVEDAFTVLRDQARGTNSKLTEVAHAVVDGRLDLSRTAFSDHS
ncbi:MAG TPA: GAF and ANTAR domain-containing protein [Spirillospora sp.]|nr:GAF and ANTAR domain-containing protein [Spirillospora sp.]